MHTTTSVCCERLPQTRSCVRGGCAHAVSPSLETGHPGTLLEALGRYHDAAAEYEAALSLAPLHGNAWLNLANCRFQLGDSNAAAALQSQLAQDDAIDLPIRLSALNNLGQTYRDAGDHAAAASVFEQALTLEPDSAHALSNVLTARRTLCNWDGLERAQAALLSRTFEEIASNPARQTVLLPYDASLIAAAPPDLTLAVARSHTSQWEAAAQSSSAGRDSENSSPRVRRARRRPLAVGYLSYDFREHPMGHLTRRLLSGHDPELVRTVALSYGPDDGSALRRRAEQRPSAFVDLEKLDEVRRCPNSPSNPLSG